MAHLFAYGTLMCEDIMAEVAGIRPVGRRGLLKGYCRRTVQGELYPAVIPDPAGCVDGVLYLDLPDSAWLRLGRFEGEMYARRQVMITQEYNGPLPALTYVLQPQFLDHLSEAEWDFEEFLRRDKDAFRQGYRGYSLLA